MSEWIHPENCDCGVCEDQVFIVADENGVEYEMLIVLSFELDDKDYAVLVDRNNPDSDGTIVRVEDGEEENEVMLVSIENDEEWEKVSEAYEKLVADEWEDLP